MDWTNCKHSTPPNDHRILVLVTAWDVENVIRMADYNPEEGLFEIIDNGGIDSLEPVTEVSHWMRLPPLPEDD